MTITDNSSFQSSTLEDFGWSPFFQDNYRKLGLPNSIPARVMSEFKNSYQVYTEQGILNAEIPGKMRYGGSDENFHPAVGDWVAVRPLVKEKKGIILAVLPSKSKFSRKVAGERTREQVVSANVDTVFIVSGLDGGRNFNVRRIERYLTLAWSSGANPVVVLNKVDLCPDVAECIFRVKEIAPGISIHAVSAVKRTGLDELKKYLGKGNTVAFLGSSGVGKSALINALLGEDKQETGEVSQGNLMGRHTTTRRELILIPSGGLVIDTPGMREIQLWAGEDCLQGAFQDIEILAKECRFCDCSHNAEPGCAVKEAIKEGELDPARMDSYRKLQKELEYLAFREEGSARLYEKQRFKKIAKWVKEIKNRP